MAEVTIGKFDKRVESFDDYFNRFNRVMQVNGWHVTNVGSITHYAFNKLFKPAEDGFRPSNDYIRAELSEIQPLQVVQVNAYNCQNGDVIASAILTGGFITLG